MKSFLKIFLTLVISISNILILKAQSTTWQKVLTFTNNSAFYKAQQTSDNGYIAVGSNRVGIYNKIYIVKFDNYGDTLWTKFYDLYVNEVYRGFWIEETSDKGYIICGSGAGPNSDAYLIKVNSFGYVLWFKTFGGLELDQARCVKQLYDNGFILLSNTNSFGPTTDILVTRTDSLGNQMWSIVYGGNNYAEYAEEIEVVSNTGFIIVGSVRPGHENLYILRLNSEGDTLWSKTFTEHLSSEGYSIDITNDNGFIIGGTCDSLDDNNKKSYVIKTDSNGIMQWSKKYTTNFNEWCYSIIKNNNSGYVMCGMSDSTLQNFERAFVRTIDNLGNVVIEKFFRPGVYNNAFNSIESTSDGGFVFCGYSKFGTLNAYIVKTDSLLNIKPVGINNQFDRVNDFTLEQNYPNPFNSGTIIKYNIKKSSLIRIKLFDITGKEILTFVNEFKPSGNYVYKFKAENYQLSSGLYFYSMHINDTNIPFSTKKLIYIK